MIRIHKTRRSDSSISPDRTGVIGLLGIVLGLLAMSVARSEETDFEAVRFKFELNWEKAEQPLYNLREQYLAGLKRLESAATGKGDFEEVVQIKGEIRRVEEEEISSRKSAPTVRELTRMQGIYEKKRKELAIASYKRKEALIGDYRKELGGLRSKLTKSGDVEGAEKADAELKRLDGLAAAVEAAKAPGKLREFVPTGWHTPFGGVLKDDEETVQLTGPGSFKGGAVAIAKSRLPENFVLTGEMTFEGSWGGFLLGGSATGMPYLCVFSAPDRSATNVEVHEENTRKTIEKAAAAWKEDTWVSFELKKKDSTWSLKFGRSKVEGTLPEGVRGRYFGTIAFHNSNISVKNLKIRGME